ncbi:hypothetical protein BKA62DRAFT_684548 [Auriculariales sp. MPI-PUGE-AT-0066]|nr:hypothetical protein BKA62DRAFT_684548 [Auriculariales sp. MPI-PUGE-AT-0066]
MPARDDALYPHTTTTPNPQAEQPRALGHVRLPIVSREPSRLESFSKGFGTVRSYISSVRTSATPTSVTPTSARATRGRPRPVSYAAPGSPSATLGFLPAPSAPSTFATSAQSPRNTAAPSVFEDDDIYPTAEDMLVDEIEWATFAVVDGKRLLIIAYHVGVAIWDVTDLGSVREVLNLRDNPSIGAISSAVILPISPTESTGRADDHPSVAFVSHVGGHDRILTYSLRRHLMSREIELPGALHIEVASEFIVVSTAEPALHIFGPDLDLISIIPASMLAIGPYQHAELDDGPVFALSGRLLAFSSALPLPHIRAQLYNGRGYVGSDIKSALERASSPMASYYGMGMGALGAIASSAGVLATSVGSSAGAIASSVSAHARGDEAGSLAGSVSPPGLADIARRVGEGMWSGLRALATASTAQPVPTISSRHQRAVSVDHGFSKSAPAGSGFTPAAGESPSIDPTRSRDHASGHFVTVIDLARLTSPCLGSQPPVLPQAPASGAWENTVVARMEASSNGAIVKLNWDPSGTMLAVAGADGGVVRVFGGRWTRVQARAPSGLFHQTTTQGPTSSVAAEMPPVKTNLTSNVVAAHEDEQVDPSIEPSVLPEPVAALDVPSATEVDLITFSAPSSVPSSTATALTPAAAMTPATPLSSSPVVSDSLSQSPAAAALSKAVRKTGRKKAKVAAAAAAAETSQPTPGSSAPEISSSPAASSPLAIGAVPARLAHGSTQNVGSLPARASLLTGPSVAPTVNRSSHSAPSAASPAPSISSVQRRRLPSLTTGARGSSTVAGQPIDPLLELPIHLYDLRRGYTNASLRDLGWASDGLWIAVGSNRGTVHVFPTNPYGGKPDRRSHLEGLVRNVAELHSPSVEVRPLVRFRTRLRNQPSDAGAQSSHAGAAAGTVCVTFLRHNEVPSILLPHVTGTSPSPTNSRPQTSSASPDAWRYSSGTPPGLSSAKSPSPTSFQDVLVFDRVGATLSLCRVTLSLRRESDVSTISGVGATLISGSPSLHSPNQALRGEQAVVASWNLARGQDWPDVREVVAIDRRSNDLPSTRQSVNWLAQAELSTHSQARTVLPATIYLSHQFGFSALREDFHALIRRSHLDLPTHPIHARHARVHPAHPGNRSSDGGELDDNPVSESVGSEFAVDEAIRDQLDVNTGSQTHLLPMLPNGAPRSTLQAGLGRIRREIRQLRSPHLNAHSGGSEMDDLHEDDHDVDGETSASASIGTPSTRAADLPTVRRPRANVIGLDDAYGWDSQDARAIEEAEMFDDISPAGIMDEEFAALERIRSGRGAAKRLHDGA